MNAEATFWDRVAVKYAARPIKNMDAYEQTMARTRDWLGADDEVLELGCGSGSTALRLAPHLGRITATDISGGMIRIAQEKAAQAGTKNVDFMQATADDPRLKSGRYDAVLAYNFLHLLKDMDGTIARAHDLLRPGGLFISKTVCLGRAPLLRTVIWVMQKLGRAPFVGLLSLSDLEASLTAQGFEIVETGNYPVKPISRFVVARKV